MHCLFPAASFPLLSLIEPEQVFPCGAKAAAVQLVDVRAPLEIAHGAIPGALAAPILDDDERHQVGRCFAESGPEAALRLGMELTLSPREARVSAWRQLVAHADRPVAFTCWRGGDRSRIAQQWLADPAVARVRGGTKALRRFLMAQLSARLAQTQTVVLAGLTGAGKTQQLHGLAATEAKMPSVLALDLEGHARHRGSAFGGMVRQQPVQQSFENELAVAVQLQAPRVLVIEDEARSVGALQLPQPLWQAMIEAPVVVVDATLEQRVAQIAEEYVFEPTRRSSRAQVALRLREDLHKLHKRLGTDRLRDCLDALQRANDDASWLLVAAHMQWIRTLLEGYYDPLYLRSMAKLSRPVLFRGSPIAVQEWLAGDGLREFAAKHR